MKLQHNLTMPSAIALATPFALLAAAPAAQASEELPNPQGIWSHEATETLFPRMIGAAERVRITDFDGEAQDVGVGYNMRTNDGTLILTLYVYPRKTDVSCQEEYDGGKTAIARYKGARLATESRAAAPDGSPEDGAYFARYALPAGSMRPDYPALVSDLYLYCPADNRWNVKYRASWNGSEQTLPDISGLIGQIGWGEAVD